MDAVDYEKLYPFWGNLDANEQTVFASATRRLSYRSNTLIHQPGRKCEGMFYMLNGVLRIYILSDEGREITLYRLHEGEHCVLSASCVIDAISFSVFIEAETDCELLLTDAGTLRQLVENNVHIKVFAQEIALHRFSDIMWTLQQVLFFSVDRRLAIYILNTSEKQGSGTIRTTHEQIASSIGSAREVVSRMLKRFADDGLIRLSRGTIEIKNRKGLKEAAGL